MKIKISIKEVSINFLDKKTTLKDFFLSKKVNLKKKSDGLSKISLEILPGERVGIIGGNGAGKSTLMRLIAGIYSPCFGKIDVDGKVAPLIELGAGFNGEMSARENVLMNGVLMGATRKSILEKMDDIFKFAELDEYQDTPLKYFSTGMGMRLSFAIGTNVEADILLLDEVFAGGDASFVKKARNKMLELINRAKIVVLVSHDLSLIQEVCNRVILLEKGRIIMDGNPENVCRVYLKKVHA